MYIFQDDSSLDATKFASVLNILNNIFESVQFQS